MNLIKTFKINRSIILENILINKGYKYANNDDNIDFSYYDTYKTKEIKSAEIMVIPREITNIIDNKLTMYTTLLKKNLTSFLPKTYIDLKNIDPNIFNENKNFFLKNIYSNGGNNVYVVNSFESMNKIINKEYSKYILQEEVNNMLLIDDCKTTLRIYVLITDKKEIFLYKNGKVYVYKTKYIRESTDNKIHNDVYNSVKYENYTDADYYEKTFHKIKDICFLSIRPFIIDKYFNDKYIILGADFILDSDYNPYLIEINTYPNIASGPGIITQLHNAMLEDFVNLYLEPKINNTQAKQGDWILCNPLFQVTHYQFQFDFASVGQR